MSTKESDVMENKKLEDTVKTGREMRIQASKGNLPKEEEINHREEFRKYFIDLKRKIGLESSMENILWLHLKAIKCDKKPLFDQGILNFGYRV